jgi:demethylmenaquinone methyltransferase/2-methoxy-6-polyprenyl-1,4-benzoquinol methylase
MPVTATPNRFDPNATAAMARMFDDVSPRYRLLNQIMSLGQDGAWRRAMWAAVPADARVVLDLCTGDGSSLDGLRRPGRLVIGLDLSLGMLEHAQSQQHRGGWAPRLVCSDAFRIPLRDHSVDAVTIAFGVRNLRPQREALAELARVMRPEGTLVVLEATAPHTGWFAPCHRFYLTRVVPLLGRLSPDPSAYEYLGASVLEFGPGDAFTGSAEQHGFTWWGNRSFLLGATRLWVARSPQASGEIPLGSESTVHAARLGVSARGEMPSPPSTGFGGQRLWDAIQCALSAAIALALVQALRVMLNPHIDIPLRGPQRALLFVLVIGGGVVFAARAAMFLLRTLRSP